MLHPVLFQRPLFAVISFLSFLASVASAEESEKLSLPGFFSDGMVLQRDKPIKLWGQAPGDSAVTGSFAGQEAGTEARDGRWKLSLDPLPANATGQPLTVTSGSATLTIDDVLVGEVWLCGGQSNMEWRLAGTRDADLEIPSARYPQMRFFRIEPEGIPEPRQDIPMNGDAGIWQTISPETAGSCSAVAYHFGKRLHQSLNVPVGLINAAWGGTMAQHWVTRGTLETLPTMKSGLAEYDAKRTAWQKAGGAEGARQRYQAALAGWEKEAARARDEDRKEPPRPNPRDFADPATGRIPAGPLNAMIMPLAGLTIRGALFYQGENNSFGDTWIPFQETYPAVVSDWRRLFEDEELPLGLIQIAGWSTRRSMTYDMNHHTNVVREVQFKTWQKTPGTGLIVTFDLNSDANIHPRHKGPVGERSARWALAEVYRQRDRNGRDPLAWRGPVFRSLKKEAGRLTVFFQAEGAQGLRLDKSDARGFYLAGEDRIFHHALARVIEANGEAPAIEVWCDEVPDPVAVRYAFSNLPLGSLMNGKELPAYPFRSDRWPLQPHRGDKVYQVSE